MTKNQKIEHIISTGLLLADPIHFKLDEYGQVTFTHDSTVYYVDVIATDVV